MLVKLDPSELADVFEVDDGVVATLDVAEDWL
jgi:hypothetical protein